MRILGIDPGLTGGAAILVTGENLDGPCRVWLDGPCRVWDAIDIPTKGIEAKRRVDVLELSRWIVAGRPDAAFIERAGVMPQQGISSGFIYGRAVGALEAAVILARVPLTVVEPAVWKRHFKLKGGDKEAARQAVLRILPCSAALLARKKDHGRAEALLIAMYGADIHEGPTEALRAGATG